jgi:hypothetical protein
VRGLFSLEDCPIYDALNVEEFVPGRIHRGAIRLVEDAVGNPVCVPILVARGRHPGPLFGVTAAMHGDEVNGIPVIQKLFRQFEPETMRGTVVGVPVVTLPAFLDMRRRFGEGYDLNRLMPGDPHGNAGEVYAYRFLDRVAGRFTHLVDLHTASFGRVNALYVRANLKNSVTRRMAMLQCPEIVVHSEASDGTMRGVLMERGIPAITVEVGDPLRFQQKLIRDSLHGVLSVLSELGVVDESDVDPVNEPIVCRRSSWMFAQHGGLLDVIPAAGQKVERDQEIAHVRNVFGDVIARYHAPEDGVIIGRSTNPICETGSRLVHLGVIGDLPHPEDELL